MSLDIQTLEGLAIRQLHPINKLSNAGFEQFSAIITVLEVPNNYQLFEIGEETNDFVFLLDGEVILRSDSMMVEKITAHTDATHFPLAHQIPRKIGAIVSSPTARFIRFSIDFFNELELEPIIQPLKIPKEKQKPIINKEATNQTDDWLENLLFSPLFQLLPSANLQKILIAFEEKTFKQGEIVLKQGEKSQYFYIIKKGKCLISRKPNPLAKEIKLAVLQENESFGEDSLISKKPCNISVTAMSDLTVQYLDKAPFLKLIKEPLFNFITYKNLPKALRSGAFLLDIRTEKEFKNTHIESATNIPAFSLRLQLKSLDRQNKIIIICNDEKNSETSCFFLLKNGFDAIILKNGMQQVPQDIAAKEAIYDIGDNSLSLEPKPIMSLQGSINSPVKKTQQKTNDPTNALKKDNENLKKTNQKLTTENEHLNQQLEMLKQQMNQLEKIVINIKGIFL